MGTALGEALKSSHTPRGIVEKISVAFTNSLIVTVPPEISGRFRDRGVHVRFVIDNERLVLCLKPDEKADVHWGNREYSGRKKLQIVRKKAGPGVTAQWPRKFGATTPTSAIWGPDGILRLHLPKQLNEVKDLKRGPDKKSRKKGREQQQQPETAPPPQPANPSQPAITPAILKQCSVGHSTTLMIGVDPAIANSWPRGFGIAVRVKMEGERPVILLRPDPSVKSRWGSKLYRGSYYVALHLEDVEFEDQLTKFRKVQPWAMSWQDDELRMKLPQEKDLKPPKKSNTTLYSIGDPSGHHRRAHPEIAERPEIAPEAAPPPQATYIAPAHAGGEPPTVEERLRDAVKAINDVRREMGDDLTLSIKDDGTVRASITKEFN